MKELIERLSAIPKMIGRMCSEGTPPKMSIPARPDYDEDLLIVATVKEAIAYLEAAGVREAELIQDRIDYEKLYMDACQKQFAAEIEADKLRAKAAVTLGVGYGHLFVHGDYDSIKAAQSKLEALRSRVTELVPKWVSVTHALPGEHGVYLVSDGERTSYCTFWYDKGVWGGASITHWMPLPAPPKEEV